MERLLPPLYPDASYLSLKTTLYLSLLNTPSNKYFVIPYHNYNDNAVPSVGLSTQNDAVHNYLPPLPKALLLPILYPILVLKP